MSALDRAGILRGAAVAGGVALASGLAQRALPERSAGVLLLFVVFVVGMVGGGYVAGRSQPSRALLAGALASAGAAAVLMVLNVVVQMARGERPGLDTLVAVVFLLLLSATLGVIGGTMAFGAAQRRRAADDREGAAT